MAGFGSIQKELKKKKGKTQQSSQFYFMEKKTLF